MKRLPCLTLAAVAVLSARADGQGVSGLVSDIETRMPVAGALITIRDSSQRVVSRVLSDAGGRFVARVQSGLHRVEVEHIGYRKITRPFQSPDSGLAAANFEMQPAPIALEQIRVESKRTCRRAADPQTADVWYFAKTALGSAAISTSTRQLRLRTYAGDRDLYLRPVGNERVEFETRRGWRAFQAVSVDSLLTYGFVQRRPDADYYFGPDVEVLLSDPFVNAHCFRVTRSSNRSGLVGLEFWPGVGAPARSIRGKMWLDEQTGMLKFVEFSYTGLTDQVDARLAGGRVDFFPADAGWLVRSWYIRMPRYGRSTPGMVPAIVGAHEVGAEILSYGAVTDDHSIGRGSISGMVFDSVSRSPLAHAFVYLSGTSHSTQTNSNGAFLLDSIPAGDYDIAFDHASLTELPPFVALLRVHVNADQTTHTQLAVPSESSLLQQWCTAEQMAESSARLKMGVSRLGAITGKVRRGNSGVQLARVDVSWNPATLPARGAASGQWTETNEHGDYVLCGVPSGVAVNLFVTVSRKVVAKKQVHGSDRRVTRIDVEVP